MQFQSTGCVISKSKRILLKHSELKYVNNNTRLIHYESALYFQISVLDFIRKLSFRFRL